MTMSLSLARGWDFSVERGPDCLFVRPHRAGLTSPDASQFAEQVWALLEQHFTYRLVLELDEIDYLESQQVGQLVLLQKRVHAHDGMMRVCGLSERNHEVLQLCRLDTRFPLYHCREDAVMGRNRGESPLERMNPAHPR
jgi:anti-anti-sigma factor